MARRGRVTRLVALSAGAGAALACGWFDTDRRPYTPFRPASGDAAPAALPARPQSQPQTPPTLVRPSASREALIAPSDAREWRVAERQLEAPEGLLFSLALQGGIAGGRAGDVLAWLEGTPDKPVIGQLWLFPEAGPARLITSAPSFLPTGPSCTHGAHLQQTGPNSVTLDIQASCNTPLLPRAPIRSVSVLAPLRDPPKIVGFQLAAPAPGETLDLEIVSRDRDGDGRDDVEMSLSLAGAQSSGARASFVWLDRAAGLSRDSAEPVASFNALATLAAERADNHKSSSEVAEGVADARRLYSSLCAESGVARISLDTGEELSCGELTAAFQGLAAASINADLSLGHPERAFGDLDQWGWFPAGPKTEADRFMRSELGSILPRVVRRHVIKLVPLKASPRAVEPGPHFSPLSFQADGSLALLTTNGVVRATPDGRFEYDAGSEIVPWNTAVLSPRGETLSGVAFPCERSEVSWLRSAPNHVPLSPIPSGLIAPRPGACRAGVPFYPPSTSPVAWTDEGLTAFVGATLVGSLPPRAPSGSPLSPNGHFAVIPTANGLLVFGGDKPALWLFDDPKLSVELRDCVVSNNAQSAACLLRGAAQVLLPDPKSG